MVNRLIVGFINYVGHDFSFYIVYARASSTLHNDEVARRFTFKYSNLQKVATTQHLQLHFFGTRTSVFLYQHLHDRLGKKSTRIVFAIDVRTGGEES